MNQRLRYGLKYINYWLFSKHKKGHGIHSPFMYQLTSRVFLNNKKNDSELQKVLSVYDEYKKAKEKLEFKKIGAGSVFESSNKQSLGQIIKKESINKKYGRLLFNLVQYFNSENILELGTSVGISTSFIAAANVKSNFTSIEGIPEKVKVAKEIAKKLEQKTELIKGNLDDILPGILETYNKLDLVYFDANHTYGNTINYFEMCLRKVENETVFIFDDIHWSEEMEKAWNEIKNNEEVSVSVDLFRMGLIFFKKELSKEHYVIKF